MISVSQTSKKRFVLIRTHSLIEPQEDKVIVTIKYKHRVWKYTCPVKLSAEKIQAWTIEKQRLIEQAYRRIKI